MQGFRSFLYVERDENQYWVIEESTSNTMSVLIVSDNSELRLACESKFLLHGFLEFNITSTLKNLEAWMATKKVKALFIGLGELKQASLDSYFDLIGANTKVFILDPKDVLENKKRYTKVLMEEWDTALLQVINNVLPIKAKRNSILIKINAKYIRVKIDDIEYISSEGKFVNVAIQDKMYTTRSQLKSFTDLLPKNFILVHRSYLVNLNKINFIHINDMEVELENYKIPFSRNHKQSLLDNFHLGF